MGIFKAGRSARFTRREHFQLITNKYHVGRCTTRISRGDFAGAETDVRRVLTNLKSFPLPRTGRANGTRGERPLQPASSVVT